jgi:hypothetical protein
VIEIGGIKGGGRVRQIRCGASGLLIGDWLLRSDIGEVIKTIVDDEAFPDYAMPKKPTERKSKTRGKKS